MAKSQATFQQAFCSPLIPSHIPGWARIELWYTAYESQCLRSGEAQVGKLAFQIQQGKVSLSYFDQLARGPKDRKLYRFCISLLYVKLFHVPPPPPLILSLSKLQKGLAVVCTNTNLSIYFPTYSSNWKVIARSLVATPQSLRSLPMPNNSQGQVRVGLTDVMFEDTSWQSSEL